MIPALVRAALPPGSARHFVEDKLAGIGIRLGGSDPWEPQIHDSRFFRRLLRDGSLGLGESYVEGWWDCSDLDGFFTRLLRAHVDERHWSLKEWLVELRSSLVNHQRPSRVREVARRHYDLDPALYRAMLGETRIYSCGYWKSASTLAEAQIAKVDLVCRKLGLRPGMRVLDIGCGWGEAAYHAAVKYGVEVVAITISHEQAEAARERCRGLPVEILEQDYRELEGCFDAIYSIGMFEHVGFRNYRRFMSIVRRCLAEDGLFLLHTIGACRSAASLDPWLDRYVFPHAVIPSARGLTRALEGLFVIEDWHVFGSDYDRTLMEWHRRLEDAWESLAPSYDRSARRHWRYYLLSCAGSFRARKNQLWQIVLSPAGVTSGYTYVR